MPVGMSRVKSSSAQNSAADPALVKVIARQQADIYKAASMGDLPKMGWSKSTKNLADYKPVSSEKVTYMSTDSSTSSLNSIPGMGKTKSLPADRRGSPEAMMRALSTGASSSQEKFLHKVGSDGNIKGGLNAERRAMTAHTTGDLPTIDERKPSKDTRRHVSWSDDKLTRAAPNTCPSLTPIAANDEDSSSEASEVSEMSDVTEPTGTMSRRVSSEAAMSNEMTDVPAIREAPLPTIRRADSRLPPHCSSAPASLDYLEPLQGRGAARAR